MAVCHQAHSGWQPAKVNSVKCRGVAQLSPSTGATCLFACLTADAPNSIMLMPTTSENQNQRWTLNFVHTRKKKNFNTSNNFNIKIWIYYYYYYFVLFFNHWCCQGVWKTTPPAGLDDNHQVVSDSRILAIPLILDARFEILDVTFPCSTFDLPSLL